jgi:Tfp pilus assembly protein PilF
MAVVNFADIILQLNRPVEARKLVEGLVRKYPNYAEAHAALAAILWSEDRRSSAEDQFTEATIREPLYREIGYLHYLLLPKLLFDGNLLISH